MSSAAHFHVVLQFETEHAEWVSLVTDGYCDYIVHVAAVGCVALFTCGLQVVLWRAVSKPSQRYSQSICQGY